MPNRKGQSTLRHPREYLADREENVSDALGELAMLSWELHDLVRELRRSIMPLLEEQYDLVDELPS